MTDQETIQAIGANLQMKIAELLSRFRFKRTVTPQSDLKMHNLLAANPQSINIAHAETAEWMTNVIRTKLNELSGKFLNTNIQFHESLCTLCIEFRANKDFPIPANLYVELHFEPERKMLCVSTMYIIFPSSLMQDNGWREIELSPNAPDNLKLDNFLDKSILEFIENYLQANELDSPYMKSDLVRDPVCEAHLPKSKAEADLEYEGKKYFFCSNECRERFLLAPNMYTHRLSSK